MQFALPLQYRLRSRRRRALRVAIATVLRAPLVLKIIGANLVIATLTLWAAIAMHVTAVSDHRLTILLVGAIAVAQVLNAVLVVVALRPLRSVEDVAARIGAGDASARVPVSPLADRRMARLGQSLNRLLDSLMHERTRLRQLAAEVIHTQDDERARVAHELHDSIAQSMTAIALELSALERSCTDSEVAERLEGVRATTADALEEVRSLSHAMHPRALEELGLPAALRALARRTHEPNGTRVRVATDTNGYQLSVPIASVLYRVAEEALANAVRHAGAATVDVRLLIDDAHATLEVEDDGQGFDVRGAGLGHVARGLFCIRERVGLVDGAVDIDSEIGRGSLIRARIPLTPGSAS